MKRAILAGGFLLSAFCWMSCTKNPDTASTPDPTSPTAARAVTYQLVWQDEFNGSSVNTGNWNIDNGNPGVNNEKEYYQSANAAVTGGNLVITARKQSMGGQPYTSAKLTTAGKFQPTYGRIEARIK
ncbi:MAG TPA: glycoside hydrolase family 16 protein, partial [Chitinophaga sp.]